MQINTKCLSLAKKAICTRIDFQHVDVLDESNWTLAIYGCGLSFDRKVQTVLIKINLNDQIQSLPADEIQLQIKLPFTSSISTALPSPSQMPTHWEVETKRSMYDVYP